MAGDGQPPKISKPSIKYRHNPIDGAFFEFAEFNREDYFPGSSDNNQQNGKRNESKSAEKLSTADLISAIGEIWDCATRPLSSSEPKTHLNYDNMNLTKRNMSSFSTEEQNVTSSTSGKGQYFSVNVVPTSHSSPMVQPNLESLKVTQKISFFEPCSESHINYLFWRFVQSGSSTQIESFREKGLASVGISYDLENVYEWMSEITLTRLKHLVKSRGTNKKKQQLCYTTERRNTSATCSKSIDASSHSKNMNMGNADCRTELAKPLDSSLGQTEKSFMNKQVGAASLFSEYFLEPVRNLEEIDNVTSISRLHTDYVNLLALGTSAYEENHHNSEKDHLQESKKNQLKEFSIEDKSKVNILSSRHDRPGFARQEHAFAGAFAGIFVSLCLHPVDTIKTVTQSCRTDHKSIHDISRSIISERGVTGLYRGIASNIASSAPISAVYTFTYESVKGALLPLFAKEYHPLAHCVAGGCASIATSFIFTPSECIKQQMQVSSRYQSCWNAFIGIVKKGGFSSLYAGWGAVLCRNVPHSIIKFYTYESLKKLMLSSLQSNGQNDTLRTLVCGGLAGSTAAFFTTPFDVVKTRLQTQIPGSNNQFDGVVNTLTGIAKHEGLKGLYRGLTPRLVMYMTQGALFFASYESFKRLLSLEAPSPRSAQTIQYEPNMKDYSTDLPKAA